MLKKILAIATLLTLCLFTLPALAENAAAATATVTATGTGAVILAPDRAVFTAGVTTQDKTVQAAQTANAAAMQQVLDALKALGVAAEDLQTSNYSINPVYNYDSSVSGDQQTLVGYSVSNAVTVTVRALDTLPALLDGAAAAGANQTYGISFESSQTDAAYDQALTAAAQDALRRATLIAKAIGRDAGDVESIAEANDVYVSYSAKAMDYAAAGTPVEVGTLSVTASVRVVVRLK
jgi:uncharacterized protein YggE